MRCSILIFAILDTATSLSLFFNLLFFKRLYHSPCNLKCSSNPYNLHIFKPFNLSKVCKFFSPLIQLWNNNYLITPLQYPLLTCLCNQNQSELQEALHRLMPKALALLVFRPDVPKFSRNFSHNSLNLTLSRLVNSIEEGVGLQLSAINSKMEPRLKFCHLKNLEFQNLFTFHFFNFLCLL